VTQYQLYWGETHHNTFQFREQDPPFCDVLKTAATHLDFLAAAYYTACADAFEPGGHVFETGGRKKLVLEGWKPAERIEAEWAEVCRCTSTMNEDGRFVVFPGYEWQGDGQSGDHNVIGRTENLPVFRVNSAKELYARLADHDALAIPHHTAYRPGVRSKDWAVCNKDISPFTEVFSVHGCSETDEELIGLRVNPSMGPGVGGGTYQDALNRGLRLGAICSTDGWTELPGQYGRGLMGCYAAELTRDALWEAFRARRVYGVTGDRIALKFTVNDYWMGECVNLSGPRRIRVEVRGCDAIDRIEILRNDRVIATHCHQGTWSAPAYETVARFKLRIEAGWGPRPNQLDVSPRDWTGQLDIENGTILGYQPCWVTGGQGVPVIEGGTARFTMNSRPHTASERHQNANIFEFECRADAKLRITLNGLEEMTTLGQLLASSREMWFQDECVRLLEARCGIAPYSPERRDIYHHAAYKAKLHRVIPEAGYAATFEIEDDEPVAGECHYRARVEQRNGQRAWSSPVWVRDDCP